MGLVNFNYVKGHSMTGLVWGDITCTYRFLTGFTKCYIDDILI